MQFLVVIGHAPKQVPKEELDDLTAREGAHAAEEYGAGFLRQVWSRSDAFGVCAVLEADSEQEARAKLDDFPLKAAGVSRIEQLVPLAPYWGFAHS